MQTPQPIGGVLHGFKSGCFKKKSAPYYLLEANAIFQGIHYCWAQYFGGWQVVMDTDHTAEVS